MSWAALFERAERYETGVDEVREALARRRADDPEERPVGESGEEES